MSLDLAPLREPRRLLAIAILALVGAAAVVWLLARGDLAGADARAYWGGVRLWLAGGDLLDPPPPYMPYVYVPWSIPLFVPWAALPWDTAWFAWRGLNICLLLWSASWAYRRHPLATALLLGIVALPLIATLDTGNITFMCAMGVWATAFVGPRLGGGLWALATALKWFPLVLLPVLPPRSRLWGLGWLALAAVLSLAVWPETRRQLELAIGFPRPLRLDYLLLLWAAVPWAWSHPRWFEVRTWPDQVREATGAATAAWLRWWKGPRRTASARVALIGATRSFFGLG